MATNITISIANMATINRTVGRISDCMELNEFDWIDINDVNRDVLETGYYDVTVGDTRITVTQL